MHNVEFRSFEVPANDALVAAGVVVSPTDLSTLPKEHKVASPKEFIFGGKATFTVRSRKTGQRFTFKVTQKIDDATRERRDLYFVGVLTGTDNVGSYTYLGTISQGAYRHGLKSSIGPGAPSAVAFKWFIENLGSSAVEVFHEGRCGRCGRKLTTPESIERGFGPECWGKS